MLSDLRQHKGQKSPFGHTRVSFSGTAIVIFLANVLTNLILSMGYFYCRFTVCIYLYSAWCDDLRKLTEVAKN